MAERIISNQIAKIQTNKKLIATFDKLTYAGSAHYAQIHAKGEKDGQGRKNTSLIGIILQDYSNGTGQNNVITQFNLAPEQIQFLLTRITAGFQEFEWSLEKIFGEPNQQGLSIVQKIQVTRHAMKPDGNLSKNPWFVAVSNGFGRRIQNSMGGYYMQGGSFKPDKYATINLTDMDFFTLLKRTDAYITNWEMAVSMQNLLQDKAGYDSYIASTRQQQGAYQQAQPYAPQNYQFPTQQQYAPQNYQGGIYQPQQGYQAQGNAYNPYQIQKTNPAYVGQTA